MFGARAKDTIVDSPAEVEPQVEAQHRAEGNPVLAVDTTVAVLPPIPQEAAMLASMFGLPEEILIGDWIKSAPGYGVAKVRGILPEPDLYEIEIWNVEGTDSKRAQAILVGEMTLAHDESCTDSHGTGEQLAAFEEMTDGNSHPVVYLLDPSEL